MQASDPGLNELLSSAPCDTILLRSPKTWRFHNTCRILIPTGGGGSPSPLRARVPGSLRRQTELEVNDVCFLSPAASEALVLSFGLGSKRAVELMWEERFRRRKRNSEREAEKSREK